MRVGIYVDGGNFYFLKKKIGVREFPNFDYEKFSDFLINDNEEVIRKKYYIGGIRAEKNSSKAIRMLRDQSRFFSYLSKTIGR